MESKEKIGVIDLGTKELKCIINSINSEGESELIGCSVTESYGIHNGVVINLSEATKSIRKCISEAEKKSDTDLKKINVVLDLKEFLCTRLTKNKKINGDKIQRDDVSFLLKEAKNQVMLNNPSHSIIHIFNYNYFVDNKEFETEPIDVFADMLKHEVTLISSPKNFLKNINQALIDCDIETGRFILGSYALGVENLNNNELKLGATIINLGYEKTSIAIFNNLALIHYRTIPIGSNHITKDISRGCSLSLEESEEIKLKLDLNTQDGENSFNSENKFSTELLNKLKIRKISYSLLHDIITARIEEIFNLVKREIFFSSLENTAGKNILITGQSAKLMNLQNFSSSFFESNIKILNNKNQLDRKFDACLGAAKIIHNGFETEAIPRQFNQKSSKTGIFYKLFGKNP